MRERGSNAERVLSTGAEWGKKNGEEEGRFDGEEEEKKREEKKQQPGPTNNNNRPQQQQLFAPPNSLFLPSGSTLRSKLPMTTFGPWRNNRAEQPKVIAALPCLPSMVFCAPYPTETPLLYSEPVHLQLGHIQKLQPLTAKARTMPTLPQSCSMPGKQRRWEEERERKRQPSLAWLLDKDVFTTPRYSLNPREAMQHSPRGRPSDYPASRVCFPTQGSVCF